jgi:hypothetical protein
LLAHHFALGFKTQRTHRSQANNHVSRVALVSFLSRAAASLSASGGPVARVGEYDTAFGFRDSKYALVIQTRWKDPAESSQHLAWTQEFFDAMKPHSTGKVYVNFVADEGEQRVADAYNASAMKRLQQIKTKYDPENLFRMNQNRHPA